MKKIMKTYFSADTVSAVFALLVFICTVFALVSHLLIGAGAFAFFVEIVLCVMGWNLVAAVYDENRKELMKFRDK